MQEGSVVREHRKLGPDVWSYRWWESGPNGNRVHRRIVLGTAEQLRDLSSARLAEQLFLRPRDGRWVGLYRRNQRLAHPATNVSTFAVDRGSPAREDKGAWSCS
jgi:hypothetical protein